MLPSQNHLKLPTSWSKNNSDQTLKSEFFKLLVKKTESETSKIGFIISTKVGKATLRNHLRRALSEVFKKNADKFSKGLEIVVIVYPTVTKATDEETSLNFNKILSKLYLK